MRDPERVSPGAVPGVSMCAADREVDLARCLAAHPPLRRALVEGRLDRAQAMVICRALPELTTRGRRPATTRSGGAVDRPAAGPG